MSEAQGPILQSGACQSPVVLFSPGFAVSHVPHAHGEEAPVFELSYRCRLGAFQCKSLELRGPALS